jgi:hypothetical protein
MQKIAKLNFVYDIQVVWNIFVSHFGCTRMNQEKYAFARTSEPWLLDIRFHWPLCIMGENESNTYHFMRMLWTYDIWIYEYILLQTKIQKN